MGIGFKAQRCGTICLINFRKFYIVLQPKDIYASQAQRRPRTTRSSTRNVGECQVKPLGEAVYDTRKTNGERKIDF